MKTLANTETDRNVDEFIAAIPNKIRRADSQQLIGIIKELTGKEPKVWGVNIVGFGKYSYKRKNGQEYEWFHVGFSPAKNHLTVYVMFDLSKAEELLDQLGDHRKGKGCLYIKRLDSINIEILKKLIAKSDRWSRDR